MTCGAPGCRNSGTRHAQMLVTISGIDGAIAVTPKYLVCAKHATDAVFTPKSGWPKTLAEIRRLANGAQVTVSTSFDEVH